MATSQRSSLSCRNASARGTFVETHYAYLAHTFWVGLVALIVFTALFVLSIVGILLLFVPWAVLTIWYLYRVIRGWLRLNDGKAAPE